MAGKKKQLGQGYDQWRHRFFRRTLKNDMSFGKTCYNPPLASEPFIPLARQKNLHPIPLQWLGKHGILKKK